MDRYAAFLRAINVGGRRVTNDDLKAAAETVGFEEAATFRASGNLIISTRKRSAARITEALEAGLEDALGFEVPVILRDAEAIRAIAGATPFAGARTAGSKGKLQVLLLFEKPTAKARDEVLALASDNDRLDLEGGELFWLPSSGTTTASSTRSGSASCSAPTRSERWGRSRRSPPGISTLAEIVG